MNKTTVEWLTDIANALPKVLEKATVRVPFAEAKKKYKNAKPSDVWWKNVIRPVDHLKNLRIAYGQGRENAVEAYRKQAIELAAKQTKESKQEPKKVNVI